MAEAQRAADAVYEELDRLEGEDKIDSSSLVGLRQRIDGLAGLVKRDEISQEQEQRSQGGMGGSEEASGETTEG
jgi:hypothetical protein